MYGSRYYNVNLNLSLLILGPIYKFRVFFFFFLNIVVLTTHVKLLSQSYQNVNQSRIIG